MNAPAHARTARASEIGKGFGLVLLCHSIPGVLLGIPAHFACKPMAPCPLDPIAPVYFAFYYFLSATQLVYVVPLALYYRRRSRPGVVKGIKIAAWSTFGVSVVAALLFMGFLAGAFKGG
jgi:hypothetical protein